MTMVNNPENSLPYHIRGAFRGFETALARYLTTMNLPVSQFYILRLLWEEDGNTQSDIAEQASMSESVASQVIQKMEKAGLVTRRKGSGDDRKRYVFITPEGITLREKIMTEGIQLSNEHRPDISREDVLTTISVLMKVKEAFDAFNAQ
ncbi:MarR family winged helix-turn-helix transcriptional regulator [Hellea balneolensis]|uniref:MarR family winged helix-turn-helix transcriptional regulator n=1 Tax=Hellea balneolensis TaxID=287478 RepID=UPI0003FCE930|nr:MarR family transcriptional regulator [Hellea balneolensis]